MEQGKGSGSQIFCLTWVKKGAAKTKPDMITLSPSELDSMKEKTQPDEENDQPSENDKADLEISSDVTGDGLDEYDLDNYDDDEGDYKGFDGMYVYSDNVNDPYITKTDKAVDSDDEQEESSMTLNSGDNLLVCARCSRHTSVLEVFVYNHANRDFYVHHDVPLIETPLCMQWVGFDPGANEDESGNLVALGNFNATIDIWDLNILNTLEPILTIGKDCNRAPKKKSKPKKFLHSDAILDLSWTENVKDTLASASADNTVALWDLEMAVATNVFKNHSNKVQAVEWKPRCSNNLCSGSFDGKIMILDKRTNASVKNWQVDGEIERLAWNSGDYQYFAASTDKGDIYYIDRRKPGSFVFKWQAHAQAVPCLSIFNSDSKTFLCSASSDGYAKVWDLKDAEKSVPELIYEKDINTGMVHCLQANPDEKFVVACGGQKDAVKLWNVVQSSEVSSYLGCSDLGKSFDTLQPEGGLGEDDTDVLEYVGGEDYLKTTKTDKLTQDNSVSSGKKSKKKKKKGKKI